MFGFDPYVMYRAWKVLEATKKTGIRSTFRRAKVYTIHNIRVETEESVAADIILRRPFWGLAAEGSRRRSACGRALTRRARARLPAPACRVETIGLRARARLPAPARCVEMIGLRARARLLLWATSPPSREGGGQIFYGDA